jgi:hypothetical protein
MFNPKVLTGVAGTGYAISLTGNSMSCKASCHNSIGGSNVEFYVKPIAAGGTPAVPGGNPAASGVLDGWIHMVGGDQQTFNVDSPDAAVRGLNQLAGFNVWCVGAGVLVFNSRNDA